jgi:hypothetical protein
MVWHVAGMIPEKINKGFMHVAGHLFTGRECHQFLFHLPGYNRNRRQSLGFRIGSQD